MAESESRSKALKWGWGILLVLSALLALNGVIWFFIGGSLSAFQQETGVSLQEFREVYPTVADSLVTQYRQVSIWYLGFGLLALLVAIEGLKNNPRWAWRTMWVMVAAPALVSVNALVSGQVPFGVFTGVIAILALLGQCLVRNG